MPLTLAPLVGPARVDVEYKRSDAKLRRAARTSYPATAEVRTLREGHPELPTYCDSCQVVGHLLTWCGVRLCVPCWGKQSARSMVEVARVLTVSAKRRRDFGARPGVRFVTLTIPAGPILVAQERRIRSAAARLYRSRPWRGWVEGQIEKAEATHNLETGTWHVHLHLVVSGRFIPHNPELSRHATACRRPTSGACVPACEPNLRDEWVRATEGAGSVVDVREVDARNSLGFAKELAKYVAKPFAETEDAGRVELGDWPEESRLELARWLQGGKRVVWRCPVHHPRRTDPRSKYPIRQICLDMEAGSVRNGRASWECEGEYRREALGARRLRWRGTLRSIHRETEAEREAVEVGAACGNCGRGPVLSAWQVRQRLALGWSLPPGIDRYQFDRPPLPSIQAHKSTGSRSGRAEGCARMRIEAERWAAPTAGSGPPEWLINGEPVV